MANLRAEHFTEIEAIKVAIKNLIQQCKKLKENTLASGLQKVARAVGRIINYQAANPTYWNYIGGAATAINCLQNLHGWRLSTALIEALSSLFKRLAAILPDNFQLNLFEAAEEFGWAREPEEEVSSPRINSPWFSFVKKLAAIAPPKWLVRILKRSWVSAFEGKQLTFANVATEAQL